MRVLVPIRLIAVLTAALGVVTFGSPVAAWHQLIPPSNGNDCLDTQSSPCIRWKKTSGGLSIDVRNAANGMAARGHRVALAAVAPPRGAGVAATSLHPAIELVGLPALPPRGVGLRFGLAPGARRVVRRRADAVVHVVSCVPAHLHFAAMLSARRAGRAVVWTPMLHPLRRGIWGGYGAAGVAMRAFDALAPRLARFVDVVAAATEAEAAFFRALGAPRVELLPPGVEALPVAGAAEAAAFRARLGLAPDVPLVMTITARDEPRKGLPFALATLRALRRRRPDATLLVAGLPRGSLGGEPGVVVPGRLSEADLARAYRAAHVAYVPSSYEAFSRVVIEAWQQERPVVVSDKVGLAERVRAGGGRVVPYGDAEAAATALEALLGGPEADAAGRHGRRLVEADYQLPGIVDRLERVYGELGAGARWPWPCACRAHARWRAPARDTSAA